MTPSPACCEASKGPAAAAETEEAIVRLVHLLAAMRSPGGRSDPTTPLRFILHLPNFVRLYVRLFQDKRVSLLAKAIVVAAIAYAVSPVDLISIPVIGAVDDVAFLFLALRAFIKLCPPSVVDEHVQLIDQGK